MTRIDELPPDRRAVLSLILRRGRSYAEIASALQIDEGEVREHAYGALEEIAGDAGRTLSSSEREQIADYLLAQQTPAERLVTYDELEGSPEARSFALTVARELETIAAARLPETPDAAAALAERGSVPATPRPRRARARRRQHVRRTASQAKAAPAAVEHDAPPQRPHAASTPRPRGQVRRSAADRATAMSALPVSRIGGAILLGLIVVGVVLAVLLTGGSSGGSPATATGNAAARAGSTGASGSTGAGQVRLDKQIPLKPPAGGNALGAAAVLSEGGRYVVALAAEHLAPTQGFFYVAWLYNSPSQAYALGKAPSVGSNGALKPVAQALPETAGNYHQLIITKETSERPSQPGETVLSGPFSLR